MKDRRNYKKKTFNTKMVSARVDETLLAAYQHIQEFKPKRGYFFGERAPWLSDKEDVALRKVEQVKNISSLMESAMYNELESEREVFGIDFFIFYQWSSLMLGARKDFLTKLSKEGLSADLINLDFDEEELVRDYYEFVPPYEVFTFFEEQTQKILAFWNSQIQESGYYFNFEFNYRIPTISAETFSKHLKTLQIPKYLQICDENPREDHYSNRREMIKRNISLNDVSKLEIEFINDPLVTRHIMKQIDQESLSSVESSFTKYVRLSGAEFGFNNRKIMINPDFVRPYPYKYYFSPNDIQTKPIRTRAEIEEPSYSVHQIADLLNLSKERIIELMESIEITGKKIDSDITKEERSKLIEYLIQGKGGAK